MTAITLSPARQKAVKLWRDYPREVAALGGLAFATIIAVAGSAWSTPSANGADHSIGNAPPAPPPMLIRNVAPDQARTLLGEVVGAYEALMPALEQAAMERADALLDAHVRVREGARIKGVRYEVVPQPPVDVLGAYVLLPRPTL